MREVIDEGIAKGVFVTIDARVTTFAILQMGMAVSGWFRPEGPLTISDLCAIYVDLAAKMLTPPPLKRKE